MFESTKAEFEDQRKAILMLLDRSSVLNDEFGKKAKEAIERVTAALTDFQKQQQEVADLHSSRLLHTREADFYRSFLFSHTSSASSPQVHARQSLPSQLCATVP